MSNYLVSANDLTTISLGEQDTVTSVLQNIAVILSTPKGTVLCYREYCEHSRPAGKCGAAYALRCHQGGHRAV